MTPPTQGRARGAAAAAKVPTTLKALGQGGGGSNRRGAKEGQAPAAAKPGEAGAALSQVQLFMRGSGQHALQLKARGTLRYNCKSLP